MIASRADLANARHQRALFAKGNVDLTNQDAEADYFTQGSTGVPAAGATPPTTPGAAVDRTSTGAIAFSAPRTGKRMYVAEVLADDGILGQAAPEGIGGARMLLYDRLVAVSGGAWNVATLQTFNTTALTRHTDGKGVMAWLVSFATGGTSTATTGTVSYTNQDGVPGQLGTITFTGFFNAPAVYPLELASGDRGVRSVETLQWAVAAGTTAGNIGFMLGKPLMPFRNGPRFYPKPKARALHPLRTDWADVGLPEVHSDACLSLLRLGKNTHFSGVVMTIQFLLVEEE